jgi:hypothetical protein
MKLVILVYLKSERICSGIEMRCTCSHRSGNAFLHAAHQFSFRVYFACLSSLTLMLPNIGAGRAWSYQSAVFCCRADMVNATRSVKYGEPCGCAPWCCNTQQLELGILLSSNSQASCPGRTHCLQQVRTDWVLFSMQLVSGLGKPTTQKSGLYLTAKTMNINCEILYNTNCEVKVL